MAADNPFTTELAFAFTAEGCCSGLLDPPNRLLELGLVLVSGRTSLTSPPTMGKSPLLDDAGVLNFAGVELGIFSFSLT